MPELDWKIQDDAVPADELQPPLPARRPRDPVPRGLWLLVAVAVVAAATLVIFWMIGNQAIELPETDTLSDRVRAAALLEITALQSADTEILRQVRDPAAQLQDPTAPPLTLQPPIEPWLAWHSPAGSAIQVTSVETIDETSALVEIELTWDGTPYRLYWFFQHQGGRWVHARWEAPDLGPEGEITRPHVLSVQHAQEAEQAATMVDRMESLVQQTCQLQLCPSEPLSVHLLWDSRYGKYQADRIDRLSYRLPSPYQIRWPVDNQPELVVLGSLGRSMVHDLVSPPAFGDLSPQSETALTLSTFWLAHHLLDLPSLPTTAWLEAAAKRDGLPAAVSFVAAVRNGYAPRAALEAAFQPQTVAAVTTMPDYFGWISLVMDPENKARSRYVPPWFSPHPWHRALEVRFDWEAQPWAPADQVYARAAPQMADLRVQGSWAMASTQPGSAWGGVHTYHRQDGDWTPAELDESLLGTQLSESHGRYAVTYWAWDAQYLSETLAALDRTLMTVSRNFALPIEPTYSVVIAPPPELAPYPDVGPFFDLSSPALRAWLGSNGSADQTDTLQQAVLQIMTRGGRARVPAGGAQLFDALYLWQVGQLSPRQRVEFQAASLSPEQAAEIDLKALWGAGPQPVDDDTREEASLLVVQYLVETYGSDALPGMLSALSLSNSMAEWVTAVTGGSLSEFETAWVRWLAANN